MVIDDLVTGPVECRGELLLGERHADGIGETLAERAGRRLDADLDLALRMARGARAELAELPELVEPSG